MRKATMDNIKDKYDWAREDWEDEYRKIVNEYLSKGYMFDDIFLDDINWEDTITKLVFLKKADDVICVRVHYYDIMHHDDNGQEEYYERFFIIQVIDLNNEEELYMQTYYKTADGYSTDENEAIAYGC